jgi:hypothetical protein
MPRAVLGRDRIPHRADTHGLEVAAQSLSACPMIQAGAHRLRTVVMMDRDAQMASVGRGDVTCCRMGSAAW